MKKYIVDIVTQFIRLKWWEKSLITLFLIRLICYFTVPDTLLSQYEHYTKNSAVWHVLTAIIELLAVYSMYRRCLKDKEETELAILFCFIGIGHVVDKFTEAAITASINEIVWILVVVVYVYTLWKRTHK